MELPGSGKTTFDCFIFDLDGTLLDTLPDLAAMVNEALTEFGFAQRSLDEVRSFVGDGLSMLFKRATPPGTDAETLERLERRWEEIAASTTNERTRHYPGMPEALRQMRAAGKKLAVFSNKRDAAAQQVIGQFLPGAFDLVRGEIAGVPRKPDPAGILAVMDELGVAAPSCAYIGDSPGDMRAACAAGTAAVGVAWGYRSPELLREAGAVAVLERPEDLLLLI